LWVRPRKTRKARSAKKTDPALNSRRRRARSRIRVTSAAPDRTAFEPPRRAATLFVSSMLLPASGAGQQAGPRGGRPDLIILPTGARNDHRPFGESRLPLALFGCHLGDRSGPVHIGLLYVECPQ